MSYSVHTYSYCKAKPHAVICPSADGWKTRAARLAEATRARYVGRAGGYLMSNAQLKRFIMLMADETKDATFITGEIIEVSHDS